MISAKPNTLPIGPYNTRQLLVHRKVMNLKGGHRSRAVEISPMVKSWSAETEGGDDLADASANRHSIVCGPIPGPEMFVRFRLAAAVRGVEPMLRRLQRIVRRTPR
jgi:hypothetical protein